MDNRELQQKVFEEVLRHYPNRAKAVEELQDLLSIGKNAVYRRLRGDTLLPLSELYTLAGRFSLSLDAIFNKHSDKIIFSYSFFSRKVTAIEDYVEELYRNARAVQQLPIERIYYSSQEIPVFHYIAYPELFAFKMYIYALTYWKLDYLKNVPFHPRLVSQELIERAREITGIYNAIPSTELWSLSALDHTLAQIEFYARIEKFEDPKGALSLCGAVHQLIEHTRQMAEQGHKLLPPPAPQIKGADFSLYHNSLSRTNETILILSKNGSNLFTTFGTPNFIRTNNTIMCDQVKEWLEAIVVRSQSIRVHNPLDRDEFFNELKHRVQRTRDQIANRLS